MPGRTYFQKLQVRQVDISPVMSLPNDPVVFADFKAEAMDTFDIDRVAVPVFVEEDIDHLVRAGNQRSDIQRDAK